jgi:hypothetical protein
MVSQRLIALLLSTAGANAFAQVVPDQTRPSAERTQRASAQMVVAANRFLGALTPEQRSRATFALDDTTERTRFNFVPTETFARKGLQLREMSEAQRKLAHELLKSGLSDRGYFTYTQIMA